MDNSKVATLLHSVADVFGQDIDSEIKENLLKAVTAVIEEDKETKAQLAKEKERSYSLGNALSLIKRMEENDKIRTYREKLAGADPSYKRMLTGMDKVRGELIEKHLKEFKFGLEQYETIVPTLKDFKLPGGKSLKDLLKDSKQVMDKADETFGVVGSTKK